MNSYGIWAPAVGGGGKRRRCPPPLKNHENKIFATYSSLWGAFSPCEGLSATFLLMDALFRHAGAFIATFFTLWKTFFAMWGLFCYFFLLIGGLFSYVGTFLACPPHPTKISASTHGPCHDINLNVKFVENVFASA